MKLYKIASLCVAGFFVVGCGNSMPSCNDKEVKEVLENIVKDNLKARFGSHAKEVKVSFGAFATNEKNEAKRQVTCRAMVTLKDDTGSFEDTIHYTARHTDDGHVYVESTGK